MSQDTVLVNRAPVLTLWGAVVAERLGHDRQAALSLGRALAGLNAQAKGRMIGIFGPPKGAPGETPKKSGLGEELWVTICDRPLPAKQTEDGLRAVTGADPIDPAKVQKYLETAFGQSLGRVREAMEALAGAYTPEELEGAAYRLYERFRPEIERGKGGWGQKGTLDLERIRGLGGLPERSQ